MKNLLTLGLLLVGQLAAAPVFASHDSACQAMPTSAQRPGTVSCNPRQTCFNATPGNPACNAAPDSAQCPAMVNFNPRAECLAALPPTPPVSISGIEGGPAGGNQAYSGQPAVMRVLGQNVGMAGNNVVGEQGLVVGTVPLPNCAPPNCLGISVLGAPNVTGARRFMLRAGHGHAQAEGTIQLVAAPAPQAPPPISMPGKAPIDVSRTPTAAGPVPVPYPNLPQPSPACKGNPIEIADCQAKLAAYQAYLGNMGRDVRLFSLPEKYVAVLQPFYPRVDLRSVRFGYSNRQQPNNATTDCDRIYFNNAEYVNKVAEGSLVRGRDSHYWLLHELRHTEQCVEWGGRDFIATRWFKDFNVAVVQTRLQKDPEKFLTEVHDRQAMEQDADARGRAVDAALPAGIVATTAPRR